MEQPILLAVPNVSEGRDARTIAAVASAFARPSDAMDGSAPVATTAQRQGAQLLDVHSDVDHNRSVFTISGRPGELSDAVLAGVKAAVERVDVMTRAGRGPAEAGQHPHVGAVDVAPVVYLEQAARGAACAEALVIADRIGQELEVPVFLYGALSPSQNDGGRTRAELRRGGIQRLAERILASTEGVGPTPATVTSPAPQRLRPDFGPPRLHPRAGATLVAARPPLVAFNLQLAPPATLADARAIAARIREGGEYGLPGVRAIGVELEGAVAQVSLNVERPLEVPLAVVVEAVRGQAAVASAELVGLAPRAALDGFPQDLPMPGFDPARHLIENAIG